MEAAIALALLVGLISLIYNKALKPPPTKICGSRNGPPVTSPRIKLSDGRHLAYREYGVAKEEASNRIVMVHGYDSAKELDLPIPPELIEEFKIYFLFFDRAGYGESDPLPSRSVKTEAFDIEELADKLQIGEKFYIMGFSLGAYPVWSCLNYIPQRLLGATLVAPFVNPWWPCLPKSLSREAFNKQPKPNQWALRVAHYTPWLFYWWSTQKWFPTLGMEEKHGVFTRQDSDIIKMKALRPVLTVRDQEKSKQQGAFESIHRDMIVSYGEWEFDPLDIRDNPLMTGDDEGMIRGSCGGGSVHLWQGIDDRIIDVKLHRFLATKLPWLHYHEIPGAGHLFFFTSDKMEAMIRALLCPE